MYFKCTYQGGKAFSVDLGFAKIRILASANKLRRGGKEISLNGAISPQWSSPSMPSGAFIFGLVLCFEVCYISQSLCSGPTVGLAT